jgi:hypothetical protein
MPRIRLVSLATGEPHEMAGQYVVSYDADYHLPDGSYDGGNLVCTADRAAATEFSRQAAFELWRASPTCDCHRTRSDGLPNRPLSAFSVEIA